MNQELSACSSDVIMDSVSHEERWDGAVEASY